MIDAEPFSNEEVDVGDLAGMLAALREDWVINKYYITGNQSNQSAEINNSAYCLQALHR